MSTPLSNSTSHRDIFASTPVQSVKLASALSPQTSDDLNLSGLTITAGKLRDLEADIAKEAAELGTLKEAINKSEQLSYRLVIDIHIYAQIYNLYSYTNL